MSKAKEAKYYAGTKKVDEWESMPAAASGVGTPWMRYFANNALSWRYKRVIMYRGQGIQGPHSIGYGAHIKDVLIWQCGD